MNTAILKQIFVFIFCYFSVVSDLYGAKNVLFICGELSGDKVGSWYLKKLKNDNQELEAHAIGGSFLKEAGAKIIDDYKDYSLRLLGFFSFIKNIPKVWKFSSFIIDYIKNNNIDEVVLVDFPLVNVPLSRSIKKQLNNVHITYVAPPELWVWGDFGVSWFLKWYCDKIVVMYPFEVEFYKKLGLNVEFIENPSFSELEANFIRYFTTQRESTIALLVGSRDFEVDLTLGILSEFIRKFKSIYPEVNFIIPLAESISEEYLSKKLIELGLFNFVEIVKNDKTLRLSRCFCAITKPGTSTLELALLKVPSIVIFKLPLIKYLFFKLISPLKFVSLPNIISNKELFKELLQNECNTGNIFLNSTILYRQFKDNRDEYNKMLLELESIKRSLKSN